LKLVHPQAAIFSEINPQDFSRWDKIKLYDAAEKNFSEVNLFSILVSDQLEPSDVIHKIVDSGTHHLFQKNKSSFPDDLKTISELVSNPNSYFEEVGASLIRNIKGKIQYSFSSPAEKPKLKEELMKFVDRIKSQNVSESAEAIVEELYMNAMLDAPRESAKNSGVANKYENGEYATMRMYMNDTDLVISCEDPFGSLDIKKFVGRMHEVYKKGAGEVINLKGTGGAGLGCIIMFEHSKAIYLGVRKGKQSVVTCVVPLGLSYRQRAQVKKSMHLINI
jgi:hypothetical protein